MPTLTSERGPAPFDRVMIDANTLIDPFRYLRTRDDLVAAFRNPLHGLDRVRTTDPRTGRYSEALTERDRSRYQASLRVILGVLSGRIAAHTGDLILDNVRRAAVEHYGWDAGDVDVYLNMLRAAITKSGGRADLPTPVLTRTELDVAMTMWNLPAERNFHEDVHVAYLAVRAGITTFISSDFRDFHAASIPGIDVTSPLDYVLANHKPVAVAA